MHGGARGSGAPIGNRNAMKHGYYTAKALAQRRELAALLRRTRTTIAGIE
jgi:glucans biosynthesis protein